MVVHCWRCACDSLLPISRSQQAGSTKPRAASSPASPMMGMDSVFTLPVGPRSVLDLPVANADALLVDHLSSLLCEYRRLSSQVGDSSSSWQTVWRNELAAIREIRNEVSLCCDASPIFCYSDWFRVISFVLFWNTLSFSTVDLWFQSVHGTGGGSLWGGRCVVLRSCFFFFFCCRVEREKSTWLKHTACTIIGEHLLRSCWRYWQCLVFQTLFTSVWLVLLLLNFFR